MASQWFVPKPAKGDFFFTHGTQSFPNKIQTSGCLLSRRAENRGPCCFHTQQVLGSLFDLFSSSVCLHRCDNNLAGTMKRYAHLEAEFTQVLFGIYSASPRISQILSISGSLLSIIIWSYKFLMHTQMIKKSPLITKLVYNNILGIWSEISLLDCEVSYNSGFWI